MKLILIVGLLFSLTACKYKVVEDSSAFALASGDHTMILGGCQRPMVKGYDACQLRKSSSMPPLRLVFLNSAEYAVSDCNLGIFKSGSSGPGEVLIDLSPLTSQIHAAGFCLLRVEAVEHYADPNSGNSIRDIPLAGGWFVEILDDAYLPIPAPQEVSWCYKVSRTNKGRTQIEDCP